MDHDTSIKHEMFKVKSVWVKKDNDAKSVDITTVDYFPAIATCKKEGDELIPKDVTILDNNLNVEYLFGEDVMNSDCVYCDVFLETLKEGQFKNFYRYKISRTNSGVQFILEE